MTATAGVYGAISKTSYVPCSVPTTGRKMLATHGTLLPDERLQLVVEDLRKLKLLEGRVVLHGEEEAGREAGGIYLLLEGTDGKTLTVRSGVSALAAYRSMSKPACDCIMSQEFDHTRPQGRRPAWLISCFVAHRGSSRTDRLTRNGSYTQTSE